jgi:lipopolysaccharide transport system permease protein
MAPDREKSGRLEPLRSYPVGMVSTSDASRAAHTVDTVAPGEGGSDAAARVVRVEGGNSWAAGLPDLWAYREVLYFMLVRNLRIHYRQAVLGGAWAVLQPLAMMGVLVLVAHVLIKVPSGGVPYPLFAFAALVPWTLFSQSITVAAESIVRDVNLVSKVYVPRLIIPAAAIGALIVDFVIALAMFLVLMVLYSRAPGLDALAWIPALAVLTLAVSLGVGVWLSALMVMYRDVRWAVPLLSQIWFLATPVAYSATLIPADWRPVYGLNPMAGVVEGFRSALIGGSGPATSLLAVSAAVALLLLVGGLRYFRRVDRLFADVI